MNEPHQLPEFKILNISAFSSRPSCPKCGATTWSLLKRILGLRCGEFSTLYCVGGKPPEEEHTTFIFTHTHENICAGLNHEHMHVRCGGCGYMWLSDTKKV
jgi:predicted nucleic-acid-binding Zn-ribbon protein